MPQVKRLDSGRRQLSCTYSHGCQFVLDACHPNGSQRRFRSLVACLHSSSVEGLLLGIASDHPIAMWDSGLQRRLSDSPRRLVSNHLVVKSTASNQASQADNCVESTGLCQQLGSNWNLIRSWNMNHPDAGRRHLMRIQSMESATEQLIRNERIEFADNDSVAKPVHRNRCRDRLRFRSRFLSRTLSPGILLSRLSQYSRDHLDSAMKDWLPPRCAG